MAAQTVEHLAKSRILVVDDSPQIQQLLARLLTADGHEVRSAADGETALGLMDQEAWDLVLLDVEMPGPNGFEVCRSIKDGPQTRLTPVVLVTALNARDDRLRGINAGADDFISKPIDTTELKARVGSLVRLKRYTDELDSAEAIIFSLAQTIEARNPYTQGHCSRLSRYSAALGERLGLPAASLGVLRRGAFLHDIGKVGIADAILLKDDTLTPAEYEVMKQHTVIGDKICSALRSLALARPIVRHHHEKRDGSGYPDRLCGDSIPLFAQIVGIADTYDAVTTTRPYQVARAPECAFAELNREVAKGWRRADLVNAFIALGRDGELARLAQPDARHPDPWEQSLHSDTPLEALVGRQRRA